MNQKIITFSKIVAGIALVAGAASFVSAYTGPTGVFPAGDVPTPVNTGTVDQIKAANLGVTKSLFAGDSVVASKASRGLKGIFGCIEGPSSCLLASHDPANTDSLQVGIFDNIGRPASGLRIAANGALQSGGFLNGQISKGIVAFKDLFYFQAGEFDANQSLTKGFHVIGPISIAGYPQGYAGTVGTPLVVDTSGLSGSYGTDALYLTTNPANDYASVVSSAPKINFWNKTLNKRASVLADKGDFNDTIRVGGGNPAAGKVLAATDTSGNAVWTSPTTSSTDGMIKYVRASAVSGSARSVFCGGPNLSDAQYDSQWIVIGGGGDCEFGTQISQPVVDRQNTPHGDGGSSTPAIGWHVDCLDAAARAGGGTVIVSGGDGRPGGAHAEAICMKRQSFVTGFSTGGTTVTPGGGGGGGGTTPPVVATWHDVPSATPTGSAGQSCTAWLAANGITYGGSLMNVAWHGTIGGILPEQSYDGSGNSLQGANGGCMYTKTVGTTKYCATGAANAARTITIAGTAQSFAPTASCPSGSVEAPGVSPTTQSIVGTTQIKS